MMNMAGVNGAVEAAGAGRTMDVAATVKARFQYGPVTINGGVGVLSLSKRYNPETVAAETVREIPAEALANAHITLRELKEMVESTEKVKLPSFKQLMEMESPVVAVRTVNGAVLTVYENGFAAYEQEKSHTVMAVDKLGGYRYDFVDGANEYVPEDVFEDMEWSVRLVMEGEKKLEHNRSVNAERNETSQMDSDGTENLAVGMIDFLEEANREILADKELKRLYAALDKLTERQQQIIQLYYFKEMTQQEIADELGISQRAVGYALEAAIKKLKKIF